MMKPGFDIATTLLDERSRQINDGTSLIGHRLINATDIGTATQ
jgi:hypothetical protein